ncbi:MAG: hypothetical protein GC164_05710 [Phycisphaera sp.]|nr:hypothetical protein [Phycisphaera sp.]
MQARLDKHSGGREVHVELTDEFVWSCDNKEVEDALNQTCPMTEWSSNESTIRYGMYRAAQRLGADLRFVRFDRAG